jgi:hypothetical protein
MNMVTFPLMMAVKGRFVPVSVALLVLLLWEVVCGVVLLLSVVLLL